MRIDTRPKYKVKEIIVAQGFENLTIPYKGKVLEKVFDKGVIVIGNESNINGQNIVIVQENIAEKTFDKDTKQPFNGMVYFTLDPSKLEKIQEVQYKTETQGEPVSDFKYYTSENFLKKASVSVIPVGLIVGYCYYKKFSLLKSALLVSIPIVGITIMQNIGFGGGKNAYWGIFIPPSVKSNSMKQIKLEP
jgi:hypothetical protein